VGRKNNKYRIFGIISPVDLIIIAGLIFFASWALFIFAAPTAASPRISTTIRYTIELVEKESGFHERILIGSTLYDSQRGFAIGRIVETYALPYREDAPDEINGIFRRPTVDGLEFTYIVIEAAAQINDNATLIGQYDVMVNKEVFVTSRSVAGKGYITSIERLH
jgi:hypothetical protein